MCQLSDNCEMAFIVLFSFSLVARYCLSILITISMGFKNEVIILSIFSLLCTIFLTIVFFCCTAIQSYSSYYSYSDNNYTYTVQIDLEKEPYEHYQERIKKQDFYYKLVKIILCLSYIFSIGVIEEFFRIDKSFKNELNYFIFYIMSIIIELFAGFLFKYSDYLKNKNKK